MIWVDIEIIKDMKSVDIYIWVVIYVCVNWRSLLFVIICI